jgi:metallo-beta-lactamase class B
MQKRLLVTLALVIGARGLFAQTCADCAEWNAPHAAVPLFGNTFYVGTNGLSAILVTSPRGHVLIDGGLPESAERIRANIESLGFHVEGVKVILNSHAHYDHAGGIAELQRLSGARVIVSPASARELAIGGQTPDDPQFGLGIPFPRVGRLETVKDGETIRVGPLELTAHYTGGHTPGGTTWTWRSCEGTRCVDFVYADSQTPVSRDGFLFTSNAEYPTAIQDFEHGQAVIEKLACDILVTPHPGASRLFERVASKTLVDRGGCAAYVKSARTQLAARVARERRGR